MKISIGNDHAGPQLKAEIVKMLREQGHEVINFGTDTEFANFWIYKNTK